MRNQRRRRPDPPKGPLHELPGRLQGHSRLHLHEWKGKTLVPIWRTIPNIENHSWSSETMPEVLWCLLLLSELGRARGLDVMRQVAAVGAERREAMRGKGVTHSALEGWSMEEWTLFSKAIAKEGDASAALRPILLFPELPARELWAEIVEREGDPNEEWPKLAKAVADGFDRRSEAGTDAQWLRVVFCMLTDTLQMRSREFVEGLWNYPNGPNMPAIRTDIRCTEPAIDELVGRPTTGWADKFWARCHAETVCLGHGNKHKMTEERKRTTTLEQVAVVADALVAHCRRTQAETSLDSKHEALFGGGLYAVGILRELLGEGVPRSVIARLGLRTIAELLITLKYLTAKGTKELWDSFREYGTGQAKLALLKLEEVGVPSHVTVDELQALANEDNWEEFVTIDVGNWEKLKARDLSIEGGAKAEYDRFYQWPSVFAHARWSAIRNVAFETCLNPLHRLHRIPRDRFRELGNVVPDACELVDSILGLIDAEYPGLSDRVSVTG